MIRQRLGKDLLFFDGGMGTLLQEKGLAPGELPETWNLTHSEEIYKIHRQYIEAGSDIILTNTFGANALKFHDDSCSLEEIIKAAVSHVKKAEREALLQTGDERKIYTALDVGPTGKLLKPMGDLEFETAYEAFKEVVILGEQAGADLIHIETMSDTYELKAAVLAAKENTSLPVFATVIFDERKKTFDRSGCFICCCAFRRFRRRCSRDKLRNGTKRDASGVGRTDQIFVCSDYCKAKCRTSETERRENIL